MGNILEKLSERQSEGATCEVRSSSGFMSIDSYRRLSEQQSEGAIHEVRSSSGFMPVAIHQRPSTSQGSNSRKVVSAIHGNIYQLKYLMLILYRAWKTGHLFCLDTEVIGAENFDDVVLDYRDDSGNEVRSFLQVKHKLDGRKTISACDLLADDGTSKPFSILKYFKSWRKIKDHPKFTRRKSKHFILYTNIGLDVKSLKDEKIEISESESEVRKFDEFLIVMDEAKPTPLYNLRPEKGSKLHHKLESVSDVNVLARELAQRIYKDEKIDRNTAIFKEYSAALAKEIIDTGSQKLFPEFVGNHNLSEKAKKFRSIFFENIKTLFQSAKMYPSDEDIWKRLEEKTLKISGKFCQKFQSATGPEATTFRELPDDDMSNKEILDFFGEFFLAVNQPNEVELGKIIKREINADSILNHLNADLVVDALQNYMLDWLKKKSRDILVNKDADDFFNKIEFELNSPIAMHMSLDYTQNLDGCGIRFKRESTEVQNFVNSSDSTTKKILEVINSNETFLTALRVYQTLMTIPKFEPDDSVIFITLKSLLSQKTMETVSVAFKWPQKYYLLIVDCEIISPEQCRDELWNSLNDIMKQNTNKKMILIIQGTDEPKIPFKNSYEVLIENNIDYNINSLEKSSQQKLLERNLVRFQGKDECFGRLFGIDVDDIESEKSTDLGRIINSKILAELIKKNAIRIGGDITGLSETESSYYIPRKIVRHVVIKVDIIKASGIKDLYAIGGIDRGALTQLAGNETVIRSFDDRRQIDSQRRVCFVLDHGREAHQFKVLCQQNADRKIHWLQGVSRKLIWIRSLGDVSDLVKYKDVNQGHLDEDIISRILSAHLANDKENETKNEKDQLGANSLDADDFAAFDKHRRIVILSDIAGMGKTIVLTYLSQKIKDEQPSSLVITINLRLHTTVLKEELENRTFGSNNTDGAVEFLVDKLERLDTDLERQVYKTILNGDGEAVLLFDGFDEISPTYGHIVVELLQALVKNISIQKIIVTTRPHTSEALEKKLGTFSYSLQPFSPENQIDLFKKIWKQGLSGNYSDETLEKRLELHAKRLIKLLENSVHRKMMDFTGVPLQTMMLAHIYPYHRAGKEDTSIEKTDEITASKDIRAKLPEKIDIIDLYGKFVHEKFEIRFTQKQSGDHTNPAAIESHEDHCFRSLVEHRKFALGELFGGEIVSILLPPQHEVKHSEEYLRKRNTAAERTGLVTLDSEGKRQFIHRTFAEYFAATFLIEILKDDSRNQQVRKFFVAELFLEPKYKTIRAFLDCLLLKETDAVKNESWKLDLRKHRDESGQTVYHVAVIEYNFEIVKFFLNRLGGHYKNDSEKQDTGIDICDWDNLSPLAMAIQGVHDLNVVKLIVEGGADIHRKNFSTGETPLHVSVASSDNLAVVKYLCDKGADITSRNYRDRTPLHYAFHRNLDMLKYLVKEVADLNTRDQKGNTPLHDAAAKADGLHGAAASVNHDRNAYGGTPLHTATEETNYYDIVKHLCDQGANVECQNDDGATPLHLAVVRRNNLEVVRYLCDKGANPNCQNEDRETPLHLTVSGPSVDLEVVRYLCNKGANPNCENENRETPLHSAVSNLYSNFAVVKYLCDKGANPDYQNKYGETPLHLAIRRPNNIEMVKYLCDTRAEIEFWRDPAPAQFAMNLDWLWPD